MCTEPGLDGASREANPCYVQRPVWGPRKAQSDNQAGTARGALVCATLIREEVDRLTDDDAEPTTAAAPDGDETEVDSDARLTEPVETAAKPLGAILSRPMPGRLTMARNPASRASGRGVSGGPEWSHSYARPSRPWCGSPRSFTSRAG